VSARRFQPHPQRHLHAKQTRAANNDFLHFLSMVIIEPRGHAETRPQRRAYHSRARGRANQCKFRQVQAQTARLRSLINNDVEPVIFHGRIKIFFDSRLQPVDLVDEKHVAFSRLVRRPANSTGLFNHWATGVFNVHTHRVGDDVSERRFAEADGPLKRMCSRTSPRFLAAPPSTQRLAALTWPVHRQNCAAIAVDGGSG